MFRRTVRRSVAPLSNPIPFYPLLIFLKDCYCIQWWQVISHNIYGTWVQWGTHSLRSMYDRLCLRNARIIYFTMLLWLGAPLELWISYLSTTNSRSDFILGPYLSCPAEWEPLRPACGWGDGASERVQRDDGESVTVFGFGVERVSRTLSCVVSPINPLGWNYSAHSPLDDWRYADEFVWETQELGCCSRDSPLRCRRPDGSRSAWLHYCSPKAWLRRGLSWTDSVTWGGRRGDCMHSHLHPFHSDLQN